MSKDSEKLFDAMGNIDDEILKKTENRAGKNKMWFGGTSLFACICLVAVALIITLRNNSNKTGNGSEIIEAGSSNEETNTPDTIVNETDKETEDETEKIKTVRYYFVSGYGEVDTNKRYDAPQNGEILLSDGLKNAIDDIGDKAFYSVYFELYKDGIKVELNDEIIENEMKRLGGRYQDGEVQSGLFTDTKEGIKYYSLAFFGSREQLTNYPSNSDLGIIMYLSTELMIRDGREIVDNNIFELDFETREKAVVCGYRDKRVE